MENILIIYDTLTLIWWILTLIFVRKIRTESTINHFKHYTYICCQYTDYWNSSIINCLKIMHWISMRICDLGHNCEELLRYTHVMARHILHFILHTCRKEFSLLIIFICFMFTTFSSLFMNPAEWAEIRTCDSISLNHYYVNIEKINKTNIFYSHSVHILLIVLINT